MSFISDLRAYARGEITEEELKSRTYYSTSGSICLGESSIGVPTSIDHIRKMKTKPKPDVLKKQFIYYRAMSEATKGNWLGWRI